MLGAFQLLSILKGWEYKTYIAEKATVKRGADPIEPRRVHESGWLINAALLTDDCYGTIIYEYQGADLELRRAEVFPEAGFIAGAFAQDPGGWLQKYYRPNPATTAGIYITMIHSGVQGLPLPYVPTITLKLYLRPESTQATAAIRGRLDAIAITNPKLFAISLRKVLGIKGKIDPALFTPGPTPLKEEL